MEEKGTPPTTSGKSDTDKKSNKEETMRFDERTFKFGKPKLKHRADVLKILEAIEKAPGDMKGIALVVQERKLTPEQAAQMDDSDYTSDEQLVMQNYRGLEKILLSRIASTDFPDWEADKTIWDVCDIPEDDLTGEEASWKRAQWDSFEVMNEISPDVLFVTIREVTGVSKDDLTKEWFEDELDYGQAMLLFKNGLAYIMESAYEIQSIRKGKNPARKNS